MSYLDDFYDAKAPVHTDWSAVVIAGQEIERLARLAQVAELAASIPKRMDGALPSTRAMDRRVGRKVAHLARQTCKAWMTEAALSGEPPRISPTKVEAHRILRSEAAAMNWEQYIADTVAELNDRCRLVVSWAVENSRKKFANRSANRFVTEVDRLREIAQDAGFSC